MSIDRRLIGNVEKRGEGKYRLTVSDGVDHEGKRIRHRRTVDAKNDKEAERLLIALIAELEGIDYYTPSRLKLKDFIEKWLEEHAKPNLAPKTYVRYKEILEKRVVPAMGHLIMDQLKPLHIVEFQNSLATPGARLDGNTEEGLAPRTILHHQGP